MSLLATTFAGVETAFNLTKEFQVVGRYQTRASIGSGTYDPDSDTMTPDATYIEGVRFLPTNNQLEEREASPVGVNDLKLLVPGVDLKGVIPVEADRVEIWSQWWNVTLAKAVPGQSLWIIFVRRA